MPYRLMLLDPYLDQTDLIRKVLLISMAVFAALTIVLA